MCASETLLSAHPAGAFYGWWMTIVSTNIAKVRYTAPGLVCWLPLPLNDAECRCKACVSSQNKSSIIFVILKLLYEFGSLSRILTLVQLIHFICKVDHLEKCYNNQHLWPPVNIVSLVS